MTIRPPGLIVHGLTGAPPSGPAALLPFLGSDLTYWNENCPSLRGRSRLKIGRPLRKRLDHRGFPASRVMLALDMSADRRHLAICVTFRGPTIERRSDGRAGCQQQYGQIRFEQIDVGLDDKNRIPSSEERFRVAMARQLRGAAPGRPWQSAVETSTPVINGAVVWH
jgi:hypothetical protein